MNFELLVFNSLVVTFLVVRHSYLAWKRPERVAIGAAFCAIVFGVNLAFSAFGGIEAVARAAATTAMSVAMAAVMIWVERRREKGGDIGGAAQSDERSR